MSKHINGGRATNVWNGLSASLLLRRCGQGEASEAQAMSHVASLMHAGEAITVEEFEAARTALNAVERRLVENHSGEVALNRYGRPHGGIHPALR